MDTKFSVFEILEIAEQVDKRGAHFYVKAADLFCSKTLQTVYYNLAETKVKQQKMWAKMRYEFSEKTGEFGVFDPDNYVLSHPEVMAGLTWVGGRGTSRKHLTGRETQEDVVKDSIHREKDVLTFFQGLKDFARDPASVDTVDKILQVENRQVLSLIDQANKL